MSRRIDLAGQRFGRLIAIEVAGSTPGRATLWRCLCSCGNGVVVVGRHLRTGNTRSCGCLFREQQAARVQLRNAKPIVRYAGAHRRIERHRGSARLQTCIDCAEPAAEWSYDGLDPKHLTDEKGRHYSLSPSHYVPRCIPCHRRHDAKTPGQATA